MLLSADSSLVLIVRVADWWWKWFGAQTSLNYDIAISKSLTSIN